MPNKILLGGIFVCVAAWCSAAHIQAMSPQGLISFYNGNSREVYLPNDSIRGTSLSDFQSEMQAYIELENNPLALSALTELYEHAVSKRDFAKSSIILHAGTRISRRKIPILLADLKGAVEEENLPAAVAGLDRLASVAPEKRPQIYPVLLAALDEEGGDRLIVRRQNRYWFSDFILSSANSEYGLIKISQFLSGNNEKIKFSQKDFMRPIIWRLVAAGYISKARLFFQSYESGKYLEWEDLDFRIGNKEYKDIPLFWNFPKKNLQPIFLIDGSIKFNLSKSSEFDGVFAQKFIFSSRGYDVIRTSYSFPSYKDHQHISMLAHCIESGKIYRSDRKKLSDGHTELTTIIDNCHNYKLSFHLLGNDDADFNEDGVLEVFPLQLLRTGAGDP